MRCSVVLTFQLILLGGFLVNSIQADPPPDAGSPPVPDQVLFAVHANQKSCEQMLDVTYSFKIRTESAKSGVFDAVGTAKQQGSKGFESMNSEMTWNNSLGKSATRIIRGYIGPSSNCSWTGIGTTARQDMYADLAGMSDDAKDFHSDARAPHPELYSSGDGDRFLQQILIEDNKRPDLKFDWRYTKLPLENESWIRLSRGLMIHGHEVDTLIFDLDARRGFAIRHFEHISKRGLIARIDVDVQDANGKGVWFPSKVTFDYYNTPAKDPQIKKTIELFNISLDPHFGAGDFDVGCMNLPVGTLLLRVSSKGERTTLVQRSSGFTLALPPGGSQGSTTQHSK